METSNTITEITKALVAFHAECPPIKKDAFNTSFKSYYATLGTLLKIVNPILAKNGLTLVQTPESGDVVETHLFHVSGEFYRTRYAIPTQPVVLRYEGQGQDRKPVYGTPAITIGTSITYARRYAASAILGLCIDDDDDGGTANGNNNGEVSNPAETQQKPQQHKVIETKEIAVLTQERIDEIHKKISEATLEDMEKFENRINDHGVKQTISKVTWAGLVVALLLRWSDVVDKKQLAVVLNKLPKYVAAGILSDEQRKATSSVIEGKGK